MGKSPDAISRRTVFSETLEHVGDRGDAQELLSPFGRTTFFSCMAFLGVLQVRAIKQGRVSDPAGVKGVSEDAEGFPRSLPCDYSNEPGKAVFVAGLGGGPFAWVSRGSGCAEPIGRFIDGAATSSAPFLV